MCIVPDVETRYVYVRVDYHPLHGLQSLCPHPDILSSSLILRLGSSLHLVRIHRLVRRPVMPLCSSLAHTLEIAPSEVVPSMSPAELCESASQLTRFIWGETALNWASIEGNRGIEHDPAPCPHALSPYSPGHQELGT